MELYYTDNEEDEKLVMRAMSAYFKYGGYNQPGKSPTRVETVKKKKYVVLANGCNNILTVYRVRNDGKLKSLKRYPVELENY